MQYNNNQQPAQKQQGLGDKEILTDSLSSQKYITSGYNTYANECATPDLRDEFLNILKDEHQIQAELFTEMTKRGWYQIKPADQNQVSQTKQKYQSATNG